MLASQFSATVRNASVGDVRDKLISDLTVLAGIGLTGDEKFTLRLCISEVATNAIKHGFGGESTKSSDLVRVRAFVKKDSGRLRVEVIDPGRATPATQCQDLSATGGRGLFLLTSYADAVGWEPETDESGDVAGQCVWFEMSIDSLASGRATAALDAVEEQPELLPELDRWSRAKRFGVLRAAARSRQLRSVAPRSAIRYARRSLSSLRHTA